MVDWLPPARARIGLIIPSSNRLTELHFHRYAPDGVHAHVTRLRMTGAHHVPVLQLLPKITEAAEVLSDTRCDQILFHCTASSMEAGPEVDRQVVDAIEEATGTRAASTAVAVIDALSALNARRVVLISPYAHEGHQHEVDFLREAGLDVIRDRSAMLADVDEYLAAPPEFWVDLTLEERVDQADAYFLGCTAIRSVEAIAALEARLDRPVVTSNQAALWYSLRACGLDDVVPELGHLMTKRALDAPRGVPHPTRSVAEGAGSDVTGEGQRRKHG